MHINDLRGWVVLEEAAAAVAGCDDAAAGGGALTGAGALDFLLINRAARLAITSCPVVVMIAPSRVSDRKPVLTSRSEAGVKSVAMFVVVSAFKASAEEHRRLAPRPVPPVTAR